ncbi:transcription regulator protein BACH2 isoform X3 [Phycodurus eques]|uniref:transcription regulator protein BACH2 isoform X3 n=1 Tax=Phycodurus eques TaxID=693459 RepID=UPI002ACE9754|nr:transcription regulator protein BACH2 isoform X3 [Phycodurus eques]
MTPLSSASSRTVTSPHSDRKRCGRRNLEPNTLETAEKIVDFRRMVGLALLIPVTGSSGSFPQRHTMAAGAEGPGMSAGYVKEFTRHCSDVLLNLNELRHRAILTDATLAVGDERLRAHSAVLVACSGFFYSLYTRHTQHMTVSLPSHLEPTSVSLLLDFMYTSRLPLTPATAPGVLAAAAHLQMDHVADTCREFMRLHCRENMSMRHPQLELDPRVSVASVAPQGGDLPHPGPQAAGTVRVPGEAEGKPGSEELKKEPDSPPPSPDSPARSSCQPSSPAESETCNKNLACDTRATLDPKLCNWKKYKFIVLNPLCAGTSAKEEPRRHALAVTKAWPGEVPGQIDSRHSLPPSGRQERELLYALRFPGQRWRQNRPFGRQAVPLQRVRRPVQPARQPQDARPHPLGREAVPLRHLRRAIRTGRAPPSARPDPHGGEAVPLSHVRHPLPPPADPQEPPAHPHRRKALLVRKV